MKSLRLTRFEDVPSRLQWTSLITSSPATVLDSEGQPGSGPGWTVSTVVTSFHAKLSFLAHLSQTTCFLLSSTWWFLRRELGCLSSGLEPFCCELHFSFHSHLQGNTHDHVSRRWHHPLGPLASPKRHLALFLYFNVTFWEQDSSTWPVSFTQLWFDLIFWSLPPLYIKKFPLSRFIVLPSPSPSKV